MTYEVEISTAKSGRFDATLISTGEVLVSGARDPEFEAARILRDRGETGIMETRWVGSEVVSFRMSIETAAGLTIGDPARGSMSIAKWVPFDRSVFSKAAAEAEVIT